MGSLCARINSVITCRLTAISCFLLIIIRFRQQSKVKTSISSLEFDRFGALPYARARNNNNKLSFDGYAYRAVTEKARTAPNY